MKYQINQLPYFAENILQLAAGGFVHSVYRRTINLTDGKNILALQADGSPLSPISLICALSSEDMGVLAVKTGDPVLFGKDSLTIQGSRCSFCFPYTDAMRYDLKLSAPLDGPLLPVLIDNIRTALSLADTGGFSILFQEGNDGNLPFFLLAARNYIQNSSRLCLEKKFSKAAHELSRLLGLGIGLTPSGDDFLCGVLAGLFLAGNNHHPFANDLKAEIASRLSDTIDISAAFLSCALENQFSLPVSSLYQAPPPRELLAQFGKIGHSSGLDTLCGIFWGLVYI